jgi:hypothetical protein
LRPDPTCLHVGLALALSKCGLLTATVNTLQVSLVDHNHYVLVSLSGTSFAISAAAFALPTDA